MKQSKSTSILILVPTRELAEQVHKAVVSFSQFCLKDIRSVNLTQRVSETVVQSMLSEVPDIIISTPGRAAQSINSGQLSLVDIKQLVIDEADLVLSYGYEDDMQTISAVLGSGVQAILMSATLTTEVDTLKSLFCKDPAIIELEEKEAADEGVTQFSVKCAEDEKFLLVYVVFKLQLVKGKCIVFVADVDRSYRLKLYLEQFGVKSCVLNSELPVNSRTHVVQEFNKGVYDIIIAADDQEILGVVASKKKANSDIIDDAAEQALDEEDETPKKRRKVTSKSKDYGVSRGIDFQNVACVLNFDLPSSSKSYTHRIGRTARAGKKGMALSFVIPKDKFGKHRPTSIPSAKHDEKILDKIVKRQEKKGKEVKPYSFDMAQVNAFRYRMDDALRAVTRNAVRDARTRELKQELLRSEKLKKHFEENPEDLRHLRHDGELRTARIQSHMKHVPDYLMPAKGKKGLTADDVGFVGFGRSSENRIRKARANNRIKGRAAKNGKRADPLRSFKPRRKV